jgi:predicted membrane-bound spermidine synthase
VSWYFIFFFTSGFCGILYELVWLRLSVAQFGVTTAMVSIVLSVFMAGLGDVSLVSTTDKPPIEQTSYPHDREHHSL